MSRILFYVAIGITSLVVAVITVVALVAVVEIVAVVV